MKTQIFETYNDFFNRADRSINGVSPDFAQQNPNFLTDNETNEGCWNCTVCSGCRGCRGCRGCSVCSVCSGCSGCSGCSDCSDCSGCRGCRGCRGCSDCSDCSFEVDKNEKKGSSAAFKVPVIKNIHQAVYEAATKPEALDMSILHSDCGTTHCRAGHAVVLGGEEGAALERATSTIFAAMMIYKKSSPDIRVYPPSFYESNEVALADMKRCAELEAKNS